MTKKTSVDLLYLLTIVLAGLILRLDFLIPNNFVIDADEAIVGLMAKHINEGADIPIFYYGQSYMGSLEAILASFAFKIFGINNFALKLVPLLFSLGLILLVYLIGLEIGGVCVARVAGLFAALPPNALVVWSAKARGGFIEIIFLIALSILIAIRWLKPNGQKLLRTMALGLVLGLGWWINNQIVFVMVSIAYLFFIRLIGDQSLSFFSRGFQIFKHVMTGTLAFFIGGVPFWIYNFKNEFASFGLFGRAPISEICRHFFGIFEYSFPMLIGAKQFWEKEDIFQGAGFVYYVFYAVALVFVIIIRRKQILSVLRFQPEASIAPELLLLFSLVSCLIFSMSSFGWLVQAPRYLLSLYVPIFVLVAFAISEISKRYRLLAFLLGLSFLSLNLLSSYHKGRVVPREPFVFEQERVSEDHRELIAWLKVNSIRWVRTNYWIGYRLAFETLEDVKFDLFQEPVQIRIKSYAEEAMSLGIEDMPFVLVPSQFPLVSRAMSILGYDYKSINLSGYKVIYDILPPSDHLTGLAKEEYNVEATHNNQSSRLALDNDLHTRWGSAHAQTKGMQFILKLNQPREIAGIRYHMGDWTHDWPRGLRIEIENDQGQVKKIFDNVDYIPLRYFLGDNEAVSIVFPKERISKVVLSQVGEDPVFDWSIAEIELLHELTLGL